jgi:hypothetical protein
VVRVSLKGTGLALALSGLILLAAVPWHPSILGDREIADVVLDTGSWRAIHVGLLVSVLLSVFGAAGIVGAHRGRLGPLGQWALVATVVGAIVTACVMFLELAAFPVLARGSADSLELGGPVLGSTLVRAIAAPAVFYPLGFAALGVAASRADVHRRAGQALTASAVAFAVGEGLFIPVLGVLSTAGFTAAQLWWGWLLWTSEPEPQM